jgi:ATP-dependent Lhr-like helicase
MAPELLNANPSAFLDDAPLEERRARAVSLRRVVPWMDGELGRLDPAAIQEVCDQAWPDVRNTDELHDFMLSVCLLPVEEQQAWSDWARQLLDTGRATILSWLAEATGKKHQAYVAAERLALVRLALPSSIANPEVHLPDRLTEVPLLEEDATRKSSTVDRSPGTDDGQPIVPKARLPASKIEAALLALESNGVVLRGEFTAPRGRKLNGATGCSCHGFTV